MPVSQQQIAQALNLSIITVSRALRNHPNLSDETRDRVLQKAQELGYAKTPGRARKSSGAPKRVGVIFYDSATSAEPNFASRVRNSIVYMLQKECQRLNAETLIENSFDNEIPMIVKNRAIDAAFIFGRYTEKTVAELRGIPTLAVSSFIKCPGLSRIVADNVGGAQEITEHLIALGHRRIAFLGMKNARTRIFRDRANGYLIAMNEHGLQPAIHEDYDEWGTTHFQPPLAQLAGYTAIVCASDSLAYYMQTLMERSGRRLPEDCSIVAFDHLPEDHPTAPNKITSYAPDWGLMGHIAADVMINRPYDLQNKGVTITIPGKLHAYKSSMPITTA
ncbi:MAG: LacI family DNA-binding transcriptional regulator [Opitutaceae bacterium]|jgi:DNA-binding LacI/PurR family transcriptional regulator